MKNIIIVMAQKWK